MVEWGDTYLGFGLPLQGVNPKAVSERLCHARVATTMDIYNHALPYMQEKAALAIDAALAPKNLVQICKNKKLRFLESGPFSA